MKIAFLSTNFIKINNNTKKGTEIFVYSLVSALSKKRKYQLTVFTSGNSRLPATIMSVNYQSSSEDKNIRLENHERFANALVSKAFTMQKKFDLYHVNMGNGEIIFPYAPYVKKPIVITMHGPTGDLYYHKYFSLFKGFKNVYFISISNFQRKGLSFLNYIKTIYHGIDIKRFAFNQFGGKYILWSGRAIPEKGLDTVLLVTKKLKKFTKVFPIIKEEYFQWLHEIIKKRDIINQVVKINIDFNVIRYKLIHEYQNARVFLSPVTIDEAFGFTLIESMSCGTPVVAYARGSIPEIIKDGETGFIVNPSDADIRGNWIIKKTGIEGLCEAVERIYSMPEEQYKAMRLACRKHVEANFTVERMVDQYEEVYKEILKKS